MMVGLRMAQLYGRAVSRVEPDGVLSACTGDLPDVLAQARVRSVLRQLLDLGTQAGEGAKRGATDREEPGEAAEDVVVGWGGDPAARAVEGGDVQAALVHVQIAAAAVEAARRGAAGLVDRDASEERRGVRAEVLEDRRDLAGVLPEVRARLEQADGVL